MTAAMPSWRRWRRRSSSVRQSPSSSASPAGAPRSPHRRSTGAPEIPMIEAGATKSEADPAGRGGVFRIVGRDDLREGSIGGDYLADRWGNDNIAIVHDTSTYGKGLAEEVKKRLNQRGVSEVLFIAYAPGAMDFSDLLGQLSAASIEVLYVAKVPESGSRPHHSSSPRPQIQCPTGRRGTRCLPASSGWWPVRPAKAPCSRPLLQRSNHEPRAAEIMGRLEGQLQQPNARALYSYAAVQLWAQAVEKAGTIEPRSRPGS